MVSSTYHPLTFYVTYFLSIYILSASPTEIESFSIRVIVPIYPLALVVHTTLQKPVQKCATDPMSQHCKLCVNAVSSFMLTSPNLALFLHGVIL
jgi:hypothetical protein